MLRPRLQGKLAGGPGGEPLAVGLPEGGWGYLYSTPGPGSQLGAAGHSRGRARVQQQQERVCKQAFAVGGAGVRTFGEKAKTTPPLDCFHRRFPNLLLLPLLMLGGYNKEDSQGWVCVQRRCRGSERDGGIIKAISVSAALVSS